MRVDRDSGQVLDAKACPACAREDVVLVTCHFGPLTASQEPGTSYHLYCVHCGLGGPKIDYELGAFAAWQDLPRHAETAN
jgi:hypothetical protein